MTKFLKLMTTPSLNVVFVNISHIVAIEESDNCSEIYCVGGTSVTVVESVDRIAEMIRNEEVVK